MRSARLTESPFGLRPCDAVEWWAAPVAVVIDTRNILDREAVGGLAPGLPR